MILCCLRFIMFLLNFERLHRFTLSRDAQEPAKCEVGAHCTSRTAFCIGTLRPGFIGIGSSSGSQSNMSCEEIPRFPRWQKKGWSRAEWCYPARVLVSALKYLKYVLRCREFKLTPNTIVHSSTIMVLIPIWFSQLLFVATCFQYALIWFNFCLFATRFGPTKSCEACVKQC